MSHPNKQSVQRTVLIEELDNSEESRQYEQESANESEQQEKPCPSDNEAEQKHEQKEESPKEQQREVNEASIFCQICDDFIAHSVTTACEHTFCELCLTQYMLYIDQCPQCNARIRHQRLSNNILLDNLIMDYIKKYEPNQVEVFEERIQNFKNYQKERRLSDFSAGMRIDVRDVDYVWCTGKIYRTLNKVQQKKIKWMIVKYDKANKKEEFPQNSPRIAPLGFYTARKDVPHYHRGKLVLQNQEENVIYSIPNNYDEEEEKEQE